MTKLEQEGALEIGGLELRDPRPAHEQYIINDSGGQILYSTMEISIALLQHSTTPTRITSNRVISEARLVVEGQIVTHLLSNEAQAWHDPTQPTHTWSRVTAYS